MREVAWWGSKTVNLLIVDDEYYSAQSTRNKVLEGTDLFEEVHCSYSMKQALEYLEKKEAAVIISDIEMPGGSGLQLLEKIRESRNNAVCIFLTAYSNFNYVTTAMRLASIDYLLKPVETDQLMKAVFRAVELYRQQAQDRKSRAEAEYWHDSRQYIYELFWENLAEGIIAGDQREIRSALRIRNLSENYAEQEYLPLVIQCVVHENLPLEKDLYHFTLKNITREYFFGRSEISAVVRYGKPDFLYFLPIPAQRGRQELLQKCEASFQGFAAHFQNSFNYFLAPTSCRMDEFQEVFRDMLMYVQKNVTLENHVFDLSDAFVTNYNPENIQIPVDRYRDLLLQDKPEELKGEIRLFLQQMKIDGQGTRDSLKSFYYSLLQLCFSTMENQNPEALVPFRAQVIAVSLEEVCASFPSLLVWAENTVDHYKSCMSSVLNEESTVSSVKRYIKEHLAENLSREALADTVYLTSDYLSHLFKKETGYSLTNYIIHERIERAKLLLSQNNMTIRDVAAVCGFDNVSYFSKQFRSIAGVTPREYRK